MQIETFFYHEGHEEARKIRSHSTQPLCILQISKPKTPFRSLPSSRGPMTRSARFRPAPHLVTPLGYAGQQLPGIHRGNLRCASSSQGGGNAESFGAGPERAVSPPFLFRERKGGRRRHGEAIEEDQSECIEQFQKTCIHENASLRNFKW